MEYTEPSLEQFAAVQIAIQLWESQDIRQELANFVSTYVVTNVYGYVGSLEIYDRKIHGQEISKMVSSKISTLTLPKIMQNMVRDMVRFIGFSIVSTYRVFFDEVTKPNVDKYMDRLRWTPWGIVDRQETVTLYLKDKNFHIRERFVWACKYCNAVCDVNSWNELRDEMNDYISNEKRLNPDARLDYVGSWDDRKQDLGMLYIDLLYRISRPRLMELLS